MFFCTPITIMFHHDPIVSSIDEQTPLKWALIYLINSTVIKSSPPSQKPCINSKQLTPFLRNISSLWKCLVFWWLLHLKSHPRPLQSKQHSRNTFSSLMKRFANNRGFNLPAICKILPTKRKYTWSTLVETTTWNPKRPRCWKQRQTLTFSDLALDSHHYIFSLAKLWEKLSKKLNV